MAYLAEVVGEHLGGKTYSNALGTLCKEQGEFHGQRDGLLVAPVVTQLPVGGLGVENGVEGEFREPRLDVTGSGGTVAGEDVAPVALGVDEQVFLTELHEGVADGGVTMGVKLHRMAHDVGHLVVAAVVHALHRVEDAALHGFQTVVDFRHGTLENHIRGVVEKPVLVHPAEVVHGGGIEAVHRTVVGVLLFGLLLTVLVVGKVVV